MKYIYRKENSEGFMESAATLLDAGSRAWDCGPKVENRQRGRSTRAMSASDKATNPERTSTCGTGRRPANNLTEWATHEQTYQFSVRESGNIGQEVLDADGKVVAWTTDVVLAHRIVRLLNEDG
jgi:hypothetical protein